MGYCGMVRRLLRRGYYGFWLAAFVGVAPGAPLVIASPSEEDYCLHPEPVLVDSSHCPLLFGDENDHDQNQNRREKLLRSVFEFEHGIDIVHHAEWQEPTLIEYQGLSLVGIGLDDAKDPIALFDVTGELTEFGCETGMYAVHLDDSIGDQGQVMAILPDLLLLEDGGELFYTTSEEGDAPLFRMVWVSPWKMIKVAPSSGPSARSHSKRHSSTRRGTKPPRPPFGKKRGRVR